MKQVIQKKQNMYFISHGGGPWPWLKKEMPYYELLEQSLKKIPGELPQESKAIALITAHWEDADFKISYISEPPILYDYGGFPEHTYKVKYEPSGDTSLAKKIKQIVNKKGIEASLDNVRGIDHGTFVPLFVMYPNAKIPIVQISIKNNYSPQEHINFGEALAQLRDENILIIGSGLSFHNMSSFFSKSKSIAGDSKKFDDWLQDTIVRSSPSERINKLIGWKSAPLARFAHPKEDHLMPLFVIVGAAQKSAATLNYHEEKFFNSITVSGFKFC